MSGFARRLAGGLATLADACTGPAAAQAPAELHAQDGFVDAGGDR